MLSVPASLTRAFVVLALAALTTASPSTVTWTAPAPGEDLRPVGSAADRVLVTQDGGHIRWTSLDDEVATVMTLGWEFTDGETELLGARTVEAVYRTSGELSIGESPLSLTFDFDS